MSEQTDQTRIEFLTDLTADTRAQLRDLNRQMDSVNLSLLLLCGSFLLYGVGNLLKELS